MRVSSSAVSLNVDDAAASSEFLQRHFGFVEEMAADGFASLTRGDVGMNVVFLRRGLPTLPDDQRDVHASGLILAFVVDDLEAELARLQGEGVAITMPLTSEEWGERAFQVRDPNGVIIQLVDWNAPTADAGAAASVTSGEDPHDFQALLDAWAAAIVANDPDRIGSFTTPDWVIVTPEGGPVARDRFLGLVASGDLVHTDMTFELLDARVHGDVAFARAHGTNHGTWKGEPFGADEWVTEVFLRHGDGWRCVLSALTARNNAAS